MKIARYIGDLLYDYECVVIPGLGGFLTNNVPASIQPNTHHFHPPNKRVMFNAYLKTNDGLLANYIARVENISYKEAKTQVENLANVCNNALKSGERINFYKVGILYLNKNKQIVFEQDNTINYNTNAFGLSGFVSPAIRRANSEEKLRIALGTGDHEKKSSVAKEIKKQTGEMVSASEAVNQKHTKRLSSSAKLSHKTQLVFLAALVIAMMVGWGFMNRDTVSTYYNNYSSVIPLFYSQPNAYVINNIDKVPIAKISSSSFGSWWISLFERNETSVSTNAIKNVPAKVKKLKAVVQPKIKPEKETAVVSKIASKLPSKKTASKPVPIKRVIHSRQYLIIVGAFEKPHNVRMLIYSLKKKGYDAFAVGETSNGFHRVAVGIFNTYWKAIKQLQTIREKENPAAWILVK